MPKPDDIERLERALIDQGKLIEAGFASLKIMAIAPDAPAVQISEMRMAFFAGAHHLFSTVMRVLDDGEEATDNDLRNMAKIQAELDAFLVDFKARSFSKGARN